MKKTILSLIIAMTVGCNYNPIIESPKALDKVVEPTISIDLLRPDSTYSYRNQVVVGQVISDDREGNFYQQLLIEDLITRVPLMIAVGVFELHTLYPRDSYIWLNLGNMKLRKVDSVMSAQYLGDKILTTWQIKQAMGYMPHDSFANYILPTKQFDQITTADAGRSYRFDDVYFDNGGNYTFSGDRPTSQLGSAKKLNLSTSQYASFATTITPRQSFSMRAVVMIKSGKPYLKISSLSDIVQ